MAFGIRQIAQTKIWPGPGVPQLSPASRPRMAPKQAWQVQVNAEARSGEKRGDRASGLIQVSNQQRCNHCRTGWRVPE